MNKKTVFIDLDGTIVYDIHTVIESSWTALHKLKEAGHELFVCTGRNKPLVNSLFKDFFDNGIYCAGALVEVNGKRVIDEYFREEELKELDDFAHSRGAIRSLMGEERIWSEGWIQEFFNRRARERGEDEDNSLQTYRGEKVYKADVRFRYEEEEAYRKAVKEMNTERFTFSEYLADVHMGRCIETSRKGVSKGSSIRWLSEMGLFDMKDTIGIGDSLNDLEMLKTCAYGIAMGNGEEELKKKADMITDRIEDDGFYKAFERLGMI